MTVLAHYSHPILGISLNVTSSGKFSIFPQYILHVSLCFCLMAFLYFLRWTLHAFTISSILQLVALVKAFLASVFSWSNSGHDQRVDLPYTRELLKVLITILWVVCVQHTRSLLFVVTSGCILRKAHTNRKEYIFMTIFLSCSHKSNWSNYLVLLRLSDATIYSSVAL